MAPFQLKIWGMPLFASFFFNTRIFFSSFLCILDVAYLNFGTHFYPFSTIFTHFPSLFSPHYGEPEKVGAV